MLVPVALIAEQPDLGTALLVAAAGLIVLVHGRPVAGATCWAAPRSSAPRVPLVWRFLMHDYQRQRVLTLLDPQTDPLGAGYHIIQSQIAIGSGGVFGKGWINGSQAQLEFLPERSTDFIFAVIGEELGLLGLLALLVGYLFIVGRGLYMATQCRDTFARLLRGQHRADVLRLRVRQCRHGHRAAAGRRRAAAAGQLRRHFDGDPDGRLRYPDVAVFQQKARGMKMTTATGMLRAPLPCPGTRRRGARRRRRSTATREDVRAFAAEMQQQARLRRRLARRRARRRRRASRASSS